MNRHAERATPFIRAREHTGRLEREPDGRGDP
jgi:hypothetical protein